jgi:hypothetical protein
VVVRYDNLRKGQAIKQRQGEGYAYHSSRPFFDGHSQSTKGLSVEEITRFIKYTYLETTNQEMKDCNTSVFLPVGYSRGTRQLRA